MKRNKSKTGGNFWPYTAPVVPAQAEPEKPVSILGNLTQAASAPAQAQEPRKKLFGIFGGKSAKKRSDKKKNNKTKKNKCGKKSLKSRK